MSMYTKKEMEEAITHGFKEGLKHGKELSYKKCMEHNKKTYAMGFEHGQSSLLSDQKLQKEIDKLEKSS